MRIALRDPEAGPTKDDSIVGVLLVDYWLLVWSAAHRMAPWLGFNAAWRHAVMRRLAHGHIYSMAGGIYQYAVIVLPYVFVACLFWGILGYGGPSTHKGLHLSFTAV